MGKFNRAARILQEGGSSRLFRSVRDWYRYNPPFFTTRTLLRYRLVSVFDGSVAHPFKIIYVDPNEISRVTRYNSRRYAGSILDGDWDRTSWKLSDLEEYEGLRERFVEKKDWTETRYYELAVEAFEEDDHRYGCWSPEEFLEVRCAFLDTLYDRIRTEGYKTQADIGDEERADHRHFEQNPLHEVCVSIGRDGTVFFDRGKHRLIFAQFLELDAIPVQVIVRHSEWQEIRRRINNGTKTPPENPHPDLEDVI